MSEFKCCGHYRSIPWPTHGRQNALALKRAKIYWGPEEGVEDEARPKRGMKGRGRGREAKLFIACTGGNVEDILTHCYLFFVASSLSSQSIRSIRVTSGITFQDGVFTVVFASAWSSSDKEITFCFQKMVRKDVSPSFFKKSGEFFKV